MIKYAVRSRQLIDIVGDIKREKIMLSPYFQRNIVWRIVHKQDFIKTILLGYPFPQIFLAKGGIDIDELTSISLIVDGQQRMNSIIEYIDDAFQVDDKYFSDLTKVEKDNFLTYDVGIIELQMESDDPEIYEVFKRLNRTFYSLTTIEKLASEYAPSEFMLVAKLLAGDLDKSSKAELDPRIPIDIDAWKRPFKVTNFQKLILESNVFTRQEVSRNVHLMMILNILATIERGFFNRNLPPSMLDEYTDSFPNKEEILKKLEKVAERILSIKLPEDSYWYNKANFFSIIIYFYENLDLLADFTSRDLKNLMTDFEKNIPENYQLAAKEGVNNKQERQLRNEIIDTIFFE